MENQETQGRMNFKFGLIWEGLNTNELEPFATLYRREGTDILYEETIYFNNKNSFNDTMVSSYSFSENEGFLGAIISLDKLPQRIKKIDIHISFTWNVKKDINLGSLKNLRVVVQEAMNDKELVQYSLVNDKNILTEGSGLYLGELQKNQTINAEDVSLWVFKPDIRVVNSNYTVYDDLIRKTNLIFI